MVDDGRIIPREILPTGALFADAPAVAVSTRARWPDEWTDQPHLECRAIEKAAAPDAGRGEFLWRYGVGMRAGETDFSEVAPLDLHGHYVRVVVPQPDLADGTAQEPLRWYGIFFDEGRSQHGDVNDLIADVPAAIPYGLQRWTACDLSLVLARTIVSGGVVEAATGLGAEIGGRIPEEPESLRIGRAPTFNAGRGELLWGRAIRGNRAADRGEISWRFAEDLALGEPFHADQILHYLLARFQPSDGSGRHWLPFVVRARAPNVLEDLLASLAWQAPLLDAEGFSLKDLLDQLIDRRRLLGYTVDVEVDPDTGTETPALILFTLTTEDLELPGGSLFDEENPPVTVKKNACQVALDFTRAVDILAASTGFSSANQYDRVRVVGDRTVVCCTLAPGENTLVAGWTLAQQNDYLTGLEALGSYTALADDRQREERRRIYRSEDRLTPVFARFLVPDTWHGQAGDGQAATPQTTYCLPNESGQDLPPTVHWHAGLRIERDLPLLAGVDYADEAISEGLDDPGPQAERLPPLVVVPLPTADPEAPHWVQVDQLAGDPRRFVEESASPRELYPASVRALEDLPGLELRVGGGAPHQFGGSAFNSGASSRLPPDYPVDLDWQSLIATVAFQWDQFLEAVFPPAWDEENYPEPERDWVRELRISAPQYRREWIVPGTVVGVQDGQLQQTTSGGYVRDDYDAALRTAELAYRWYQKKRQSFSLQYRQVDGRFRVGDLITELGPPARREPVETVITLVRWDLEAGTTSLETDYAQLDLAAFGKGGS